MNIDPLQQPNAAAEPVVTRDALRRPMHDLRISLLDRCNFRCPYCMPTSEYHEDYQFLKRPERRTHSEILLVARAAVGLGVSKLRLTGGEPLLDRKLPELVAGLAPDTITSALAGDLHLVAVEQLELHLGVGKRADQPQRARSVEQQLQAVLRGKAQRQSKPNPVVKKPKPAR